MEFADGLFEDAGERATPASMNGRDRAFLGIDEKDGNAICGLNTEEEAGGFG